MLWILLIVSILLIILGTKYYKRYMEVLIGTGAILGAVSIVVLLPCLVLYNDTKATADKQIAVLEQRNEEVITQIEPLVKQYLEYESSTFRDFKPSSDNIIAIAAYPELKGNEFIQTQIKVIIENQKKITELKLDKVGLNSYKLWLFMGE